MTRRLRITLIVAAVPVLLLGLLWGALLTAGNTRWGRQHIESLVAYLTSNRVRLHGLAGALPDRPTVQSGAGRCPGHLAHGPEPRGGMGSLGPAAAAGLRAQRACAAHRFVAPAGISSARRAAVQHSAHRCSRGHGRFGESQCGARRHGIHPEPARQCAPAHSYRHAIGLAATRLNGEGTYSLQLDFDRTRMMALSAARTGPWAAGGLAGIRHRRHRGVG